MYAISNDFKEEIKKLGKQIDFKIGIHINDRLITQDNKFIITQDDMRLLVEQYDEEEVDEVLNGESVYNATVVQKGDLLSTMMKEFDFEIEEDLRVGNVVDCSFGLKVGNDYEYVDLGKYIIYSKEKNEDTNTYSYVAYDRMLLSMVEVDDTSIIQNVTVVQAIRNICNKVGLICKVSNDDILELPNLSKTINENAFNNIEMTYRDVLDMICQCLGVSMVSNGRSLELKYIDDTIVDEFDEEYLKDINVSFGKKYGAINSVVLSRSEDNDNIYRKDDEDIAENGLHEFKIKDNLIMLYDDREDYIDEIYDQLKGLEFYINDFTSTGITYLDWLDFYNVRIGDNVYKCALLNDEIKVQQGLEESIYTEEPEETTTDYKTSSKTDKEVSFIVDKQNGEIKSRVTQGDMESYVSEVADEITAQVSEKVGDDEIIAKLNLAVRDGQGIVNLTGNTVTINSDKFKLDADGKIAATGGTIGGFTLSNTDFEKNLNGIYNYTQEDISLCINYIVERLKQTNSLKKILDYDNNGSIGVLDLAHIRNILLGTETNTRNLTGKFLINSQDLKNCVKVQDANNNTVVSIGVGGINTDMITAQNILCGYSTVTSDSTKYYGIIFNANGEMYKIDNDGVWLIPYGRAKKFVDGGNYLQVTMTDLAGTDTNYGINWWTSDKKLKKNIKDCKENGLDIINKIEHKEYDKKSENDKHYKIGYIAQQLQELDEDLVFGVEQNDGEETLFINQTILIPYMTKAIQELSSQVKELQKEIELLKESDK